MVTAVPLPVARTVELDEEIFRLLLPTQLSDAPPDAVNVRVTGPGATNAVVANGIAIDAPAVVVTDAGAKKLVAVLTPAVWTGLCKLSDLNADGPVGSAEYASDTLIEVAVPV